MVPAPRALENRLQLPRWIAALFVVIIGAASAAALVAPQLQQHAYVGQTNVGVITSVVDAPDTAGRVGSKAPDFLWVQPSGETSRLSALKGTPVVLNFWATWCRPCLAEMPRLEPAARDSPGMAFYEIALALGFLRVEDIIQRAEDVALMEVCDEETVVKVRLAPTARAVPHERKRILTSGCGRGVTFSLDVVPLPDRGAGGMGVTPERLMEWMEELLDKAAGYKEHGGTHTAGLFGPAGLELLVEDIGRHNTVDRLAGVAILADIDTKGKAFVTSDRISSEMLVKTSR